MFKDNCLNISIFLIIILLFIIVVILYLSELDRNFSISTGIYQYYIELFPLFILGSYNSLIRYFHPEQTHIFSNNLFESDKIFRENFDTIKKEALDIYHNNKLINFGDLDKNIGYEIDKLDNKWNIYPIKFYDKYNAQALKSCPKTCEIIKKCTDIHSALFSILEPGKHIKAHKGPCNSFLRYLFAIKIPMDKENCYIKINNIKYNWVEGEAIIFDDTYVHEVFNNTNEPRIVLFMDIKRPVNSIFSNVSDYLAEMAKYSNFINNINNNIEKYYSQSIK